MNNLKFKEKILSKTPIGLAIGAFGGIIMIFLMTDPLRLHYFGGFLLVFVMICIIFCAILFYNLMGIGIKNYWNKVYVGFLAFFIMIITLRLNQARSKTQPWELNTSDFIETTMILLLIGFCVSLLFARMNTKNNTPNMR